MEVREFIQGLVDRRNEIGTQSSKFRLSSEITDYLTRFIQDFSRHCGLDATTEAVVESEALKHIYPDVSDETLSQYVTRPVSRQLRLDLRVTSTSPAWCLDIEIDRSNKIRSIKKLIFAKDALGHHVLWLRWGSLKPSKNAHYLVRKHGIFVLEVPVTSRRIRMARPATEGEGTD